MGSPTHIFLRRTNRFAHVTAAVRAREIELRPDRHNSHWIDRRVALIIVALDMSEIRCFDDPRTLIKLAGEVPEIGILHDPP